MAKPVEAPDPEMDSLYEGEAGGGQGQKSESVDQEREEDMANTALVDNKVLAPDGEPLKAGDEIVVQVVKVYGDQSEIKYGPKKGGAAGPGPGEEDTDREIESLDSGNY